MALAVPGADPVAGQPLSDDDHYKSRLMGIICSHYREALNWLPPSLIPRVGEFGLCFGFLDPVSNIILNTFFHGVSPDEEEANQTEQRERGEKKRKRSQPGNRSKSTEYVELKEGRLSKEDEVSSMFTGAKSIVARSIQGLVTFLTSFFRYLHTKEALFYLVHADGDLLGAVHLIEKLRACHAFTTDHPTAMIALACAARAAMCPHPDKLVFNTVALASLCSKGELNEAHPQASSFYASGRLGILNLPSTCTLGIDHELSIRRVLLDKIHGFYLEAISRMPTNLLRSRLHRALLMAGHCYGPFDPVANILLNTIWYDTAFPPQLEFEVDMIRMDRLALVELRSLDGLVAFCQTINPHSDKSDNISDLILVSQKLGQSGHSLEPVDKCYDAFQSAATAAFHPNPIALAHFAALLPQAVKATLERLFKAKCLSAIDVQTISKVLSENHPPNKPVGQVRWTPCVSLNSVRLKEFEAHQTLIRRRIEAAFQEHARIKGDEYEEYKIHAICGVNSEIPEDGRFGYFHNQNGYPFSHINVWVIRPHLADAAPELWFMEYSNDCDNMEVEPFLSPVSESTEFSGRCFHCEYAGAKIMHPSSGSYRGQRRDFLDMASGEHSVTNKELIRSGEMGTVFADSVEIEDLEEFEDVDEDDEDLENEDDEDFQNEDDEDLEENEDGQLIYV
ncbi:hypothetical protein QOZ80_3BG0254630 [Eleusine coracana subsp. coracana]|nr:hypothetical protein QOZ80_3BG0254630 [Eleusine coracana subsp. coracana]